ncbi:hypothetical protein [Mucilaginibacter sp.]|uniref:hypothetical protein n=1 Tax=Mucilaginibacter sp. TaxID=1882438 RepID=UPI002634E7AA|nr:hypothetical protein [Mucilaginibacter sp.]MDB4922100.1 hypothetical protein [Mucilaginibacter sp.]
MINNNDDMPDQPLSDDPEENLRMENELLRLKLQAELGGQSHSSGNLPPEIENEFLKNIFAFEQSYTNAKRVKIYDFIGKPVFKKAEDLDDSSIKAALQEVIDLLSKKNIVVHFDEECDISTRYNFITEELFEKETDDFMIPGMTVNFDYEEFHPNHKKDIENRALEFLSEWFKQSFNEYSWELANSFILPDRRILSKKDIIAQLKNIFDAYKAFINEDYFIKEIKFELNENGGLGHAEGGVKYDAVLENGESVAIQGGFKLYLSNENGWWSIFHIVFPGFKY